MLTPMWQRTVVWLRRSHTGGPPSCWYHSHSPTVTTSQSWSLNWWHASLWRNNHQYDPKATLPQPFWGLWCWRGKPYWVPKGTTEKHMKIIWVSMSSCAVVVKTSIQYQLWTLFNGHVQTTVEMIEPRNMKNLMVAHWLTFFKIISDCYTSDMAFTRQITQAFNFLHLKSTSMHELQVQHLNNNQLTTRELLALLLQNLQ